MKFSQGSFSQTSVYIFLMSQDHRKPMLLGMGLLRLVTPRELPSCSGEVTRSWSYCNSLSSQYGCSECGASLWRSTWSHKEKGEWQTGATHQGGGEINKLPLQVLCGNFQDRQSGMGLRQSLRDIHWCFMKDRKNCHWQSLTRTLWSFETIPKYVCVNFFQLLLPPPSHPTPLSSTPTPTTANDSELQPMVEKWLPSL